MKFTKQGEFMTATVKGDGNCFYRAVLIALALEGRGLYGDDHHLLLRHATVDSADSSDDAILANTNDLYESLDVWKQSLRKVGTWADMASVKVCSMLLGICIRVHVARDMMQMDTTLDFNAGGASCATINLLLTSNHYSVIVDESSSTHNYNAEQYCSEAKLGDNFAEDLQAWKVIVDSASEAFGSVASPDAGIAEPRREVPAPDAGIAKPRRRKASQPPREVPAPDAGIAKPRRRKASQPPREVPAPDAGIAEMLGELSIAKPSQPRREVPAPDAGIAEMLGGLSIAKPSQPRREVPAPDAGIAEMLGELSIAKPSQPRREVNRLNDGIAEMLGELSIAKPSQPRREVPAPDAGIAEMLGGLSIAKPSQPRREVNRLNDGIAEMLGGLSIAKPSQPHREVNRLNDGGLALIRALS
jgi:hypothetical protein